MAIKINDHPFYQDPRFVTEKQILEKLTEICGFDTSIGVIDHFPSAPAVHIGFVLPQREEEKQKSIPILTSKLSIYLTDRNPIKIPEDFRFFPTRKILVPLVKNWIQVATFLIDFYKSQPGAKESFSDLCINNLEIWKLES